MFVDLKSLSDEDLSKRETELHGKILAAHAISNMLVVERLQSLLDDVIFEQRERLLIQAFEADKRKYPAILETEPDLRDTQKTPETETKKSRPSRVSVRKSPKPIRPEG